MKRIKLSKFILDIIIGSKEDNQGAAEIITKFVQNNYRRRKYSEAKRSFYYNPQCNCHKELEIK